MKFLKTLTVLCISVITAAAVADDSEPMRIFKEFRNAAIQNDSAAALLLTDGEMTEKIRNAGSIPDDLRKHLILITAAYEDVHVRLSDAKQAAVYSFAVEDGNPLCIKFTFTGNANSVLKITALNVGKHLARPHLENFLAACRANNIARYRDLITPEVAEKYPRIPASLKAAADEKISEGRASADSADFTVERSGIKGQMKMTKSEYFWKVSFIDDILLAPMPSQTVEDLCRAAAASDAEALKKYFVEDKFESIKEKLNTEKLAVLAGMNSVLSQRASGSRKFYVEVKIAGATDSGIASFDLEFTDGGWKAAKFDADTRIYKNEFAPAATAEKIANLLIKERNLEALKELLPEELHTKLSEQITEPSMEMTFTVDEEKIEGTTASVTATVANSSAVGKMNFSMKLENGKWLVTAIQTEAPPKAEENNSEETPAE